MEKYLEEGDLCEEEIKQALFQEAQRYPGQQDKVLEYYRNNPQALANLRAPIFENHVINFILDKAKVEDKQVSTEDLNKKLSEMDD